MNRGESLRHMYAGGRPNRRARFLNRVSAARRVVFITIGAVVGVLGLSLGAILTIGGVFVPATYLEPWSPTYYQKSTDIRMQVVAHAVLAPSGHNMQPWNVVLDKDNAGVVDLYADPSRLSPAVDPDARQAMVSQGAFLAYLRVAAEELGYSASFELFPGGSYDENDLETSMSQQPVARVTLAKDSSVATDDYSSLFLSDTNRAPYTTAPLTVAQTNALTALAEGSAASVSILSDKQDMTALGAFGVEGTLIETQYLAATAESAAVFHGTEQAKNEARSGFAVEGQGTTGFKKYVLQGLLTVFPALNDDAAGARNAIALTAAGVDNTAAYGLVSTPGNTRAEQVEAGILYAQISLRARTLGLVMQPLSQVLQEYPTMAVPYAAIHDEYAPDGQTIQMLLRIGTPTTEYPVSMRRDVTSLVRTP